LRIVAFFESEADVDKLGLCVIGTGRAGLIHARNIAWRIPAARLAAVCDANIEAAKKAAGELGVEAVFADYRQAIDTPGVEAVVIVTPTFLHREIACLAAEHGKHVFLEKPMAITLEECDAINQAVSAGGHVKLQIGFMRRFDEGFIRAKGILDSGQMGRVISIKSVGRGPGGPGAWMYDLRKSNGIVAEVNSHDLDTLRWFIGNEARTVFAEGGNFKSPDARKEFPDFYDTVVATFRFANGEIGLVDGACPCHYGYDARVEILCERGVLFIGSTVQSGLTQVTVDGQAISQAVKSWRNLFRDAYLAEMEHFVGCVQADNAPRVTGQDGQMALAMVLGVNQSLRVGQKVEV
jgi:myo-inositol 2-dehydrogenase/D-chiro-inositol 1-dehydrogenase/scyllo-inositol 2-dehydrogenase (NAD+)